MYECAGNVAWINEMYNPLHGVPINMVSVRQMADHIYGDVKKIGSVTFVVGVESVDFKPMSHKGALRCASPLESLHAFWMAAHRDIVKNTKADKALVKAWLDAFKRVSITFVILKSDLDVYYHSETLREKLVTSGVVSTPSALQKILKVVRFKAKAEESGGSTLSVAKIFELLKSNIEMSQFSEALSEQYVANALAIHEKVLKHDTLFSLIMDCESQPDICICLLWCASLCRRSRSVCFFS